MIELFKDATKGDPKDKKEIHVYLDFIHNYSAEVMPYGYYVGISHSRSELQRDIEEEKNIIFTTQTSACKTEYLELGYRIFVYLLDGTVKELKFGHIDGLNKDIRMAHNLEKMLISGMFGQSNIDVIEDRHSKTFDDLKNRLEINKSFEEATKYNNCLVSDGYAEALKIPSRKCETCKEEFADEENRIAIINAGECMSCFWKTYNKLYEGKA